MASLKITNLNSSGTLRLSGLGSIAAGQTKPFSVGINGVEEIVELQELKNKGELSYIFSHTNLEKQWLNAIGQRPFNPGLETDAIRKLDSRISRYEVNCRQSLGSVTFTVGTEAADVINVACQLKNQQGQRILVTSAASWYLATDAAGLIPATVAPSGGLAAGTDGALAENNSSLSGLLVSTKTGKIDLDITEVGAKTFHLVIVTGTGEIAVSSAITFA